MLSIAMPRYFDTFWFVFYVLLCGSLFWCWFSWLSTKPNVLASWRTAALLLGFVCATISASLNTWLYVHAMYTGGYPIHLAFRDGYWGFHPVEQRFIQWGTLTALVGLVCSVAGVGKNRAVLGVVSLLNLLMWFSDAMIL
jgi:hypothetical protein